MDKFEKKYNWKELKPKLNEFEPKESLKDSISNSLDNPEPEFDFNQSKDQLPEHQPSDNIWDNISSELDASEVPTPIHDFNQLKDQLPEYQPNEKLWDNISSELYTPIPQFDFSQLKDNLPVHTPNEKIWDDISESFDTPEIPAPVYDFIEVKHQLSEHTPDSSLWDAIEDGLEIDQRIDQLPNHEPPVNLWDKIEEDLEDVKGGISFLRTAIMFGISMLILIGAALMLNQNEKVSEVEVENSTMQFAANENYNLEWSDDEDVRLIQEMCQDYMAVCEQTKFKELESELLELNDHKNELLQMISAFDEESTYVPMLAKIEVQKTALMKEMIAMI